MIQADVHRRSRRCVLALDLLVGGAVFVDHVDAPAGIALQVVAHQLAHARHDVGRKLRLRIDHRGLLVEPHAGLTGQCRLERVARGRRHHRNGVCAGGVLQLVGNILLAAQGRTAIHLVGLRQRRADTGGRRPGAAHFLRVHQHAVRGAGLEQLHPVGGDHARLRRRHRAQLQVLVRAQPRVQHGRLPAHVPFVATLRQRHLRLVRQIPIAGQVPAQLVGGCGQVVVLVDVDKRCAQAFRLQPAPRVV